MSENNEYVCRLSDEDKAYVAANLNETDEERPKKIAVIREWIAENEDLNARTDDFSILRFLRACKFNIEKTKTKLRNYHKQRATLTDWYENRDPFLPELQELFDLGVLLPLRQLDDEGRMVVIVRTAIHDPVKHKQADVLKAGLMILDLALREHEPVTVHGISAILDMDGISYGHVLQLPPRVIGNLVHAWQGCYPLRIHSLDFVNAPTLVNVVLNVFRTFMNAKLKRRLHVHRQNTQMFYETLPKHILPAEYGGTDSTVKELSEYWKKAVQQNQNWLAEEEKYKLILPKKK